MGIGKMSCEGPACQDTSQKRGCVLLFLHGSIRYLVDEGLSIATRLGKPVVSSMMRLHYTDSRASKPFE